MSPEQLRTLATLLPPDQLLTDPAELLCYGYDNSRMQGRAEAVVLAGSTADVAAVTAFCQRERIPLVSRGAGTNTVGATVPDAGGVVLSLERMNRILEFAPEDRYLRCEAGTSNGAVQRRAGEAGMFWPPDPTSADFSSVGGNLGCNAGGPRAVKYGTCRESTLGLTAVTGRGEIIHTGGRTTKGVVGYDLTRLLVGSEGSLALITEATLLLHPLPPARYSARAAFADVAAAAQAVSRLMAQPIRPCALEFMDGTAVRLVMRQGGINDLPESTGALLLIDLDGEAERLETDMDALKKAAGPDCLQWSVARDAEAARALWQARKALSPCLRSLAPKKVNEDVVVPVSRLAALVGGLEALSDRFGLPIVNFGHAGNGNVHVNLLADPAKPGQLEALDTCLDEVFALVLSLGGSLSGEHGVGLAKRAFIDRELDAASIELMRGLKRVFDPAGILNPGKGFPPEPAGSRS